jgi:hypothetical protein
MFKPQFNTPYLLSADGYKRYFDVLDPDFKVRPVYMTKREENQCSLAVYNDDMTEEINGFSWVDIYDLEPYSLDKLEEIELELDDYIADELDREEEDEEDEE